jgi:galactose oxidase
MRKLRVLIAGVAVTAAAALVHPGIAHATTYNEWQTENGLCMGVQGGDMTPGTAIITWACDGTPNQHWTLDWFSGASNYFLLRNEANPNECLSVFEKAQYLGAPLVIWPCKDFSDNQDQRWSVSNAPSTFIINYNSGLMVIPNGSGQGATVMQWDGRAQYYWSPADFQVL